MNKKLNRALKQVIIWSVVMEKTNGNINVSL